MLGSACERRKSEELSGFRDMEWDWLLPTICQQTSRHSVIQCYRFVTFDDCFSALKTSKEVNRVREDAETKVIPQLPGYFTRSRSQRIIPDVDLAPEPCKICPAARILMTILSTNLMATRRPWKGFGAGAGAAGAGPFSRGRCRRSILLGV